MRCSQMGERDFVSDSCRNQIGVVALKTCINVDSATGDKCVGFKFSDPSSFRRCWLMQSTNITDGEYALSKCQNTEL